MQTVFSNGIEYVVVVERKHNGDLVHVDVETKLPERIVGVFFNHGVESAVVEGPDILEPAPYFELKDKPVDEIALWALAQIDC